ncbi:hypothetical protein [Streptomyces sp. NPDC020817]|uniref:DUF7674 family protein n=1 Tax=Streptomyces sp. NPDC020817 TaxID=3365095 RepID=UPI0037979EB3
MAEVTEPQWWQDMLATDGVLAAAVDGDLPLTFRLGAFADVFADHYGELPEDVRRRVLSLAEEVLAAGDDTGRAAVAIGFFEALLNKWDRGFDLEAAWPLVGPRSRAHCLAWNEAWGIESPAWMRTA